MTHLSDEAIAAFADGVLGGGARDRAVKHVDTCTECREAVQIQREAAYALRTALPPALPTDLRSRLRSLPQTAPVPAPPLPTVLGPDGTTMLATGALPSASLSSGLLGALAPMAAFVPAQRDRRDALRDPRGDRGARPANRPAPRPAVDPHHASTRPVHRAKPYVASAAALALASSLVASVNRDDIPTGGPVRPGTAVPGSSSGAVPPGPMHTVDLFVRNP